jgi:hypothetical protein
MGNKPTTAPPVDTTEGNNPGGDTIPPIHRVSVIGSGFERGILRLFGGTKPESTPQSAAEVQHITERQLGEHLRKLHINIDLTTRKRDGYAAQAKDAYDNKRFQMCKRFSDIVEMLDRYTNALADAIFRCESYQNQLNLNEMTANDVAFVRGMVTTIRVQMKDVGPVEDIEKLFDEFEELAEQGDRIQQRMTESSEATMGGSTNIDLDVLDQLYGNPAPAPPPRQKQPQQPEKVSSAPRRQQPSQAKQQQQPSKARVREPAT